MLLSLSFLSSCLRELPNEEKRRLYCSRERRDARCLQFDHFLCSRQACYIGLLTMHGDELLSGDKLLAYVHRLTPTEILM